MFIYDDNLLETLGQDSLADWTVHRVHHNGLTAKNPVYGNVPYDQVRLDTVHLAIILLHVLDSLSAYRVGNIAANPDSVRSWRNGAEQVAELLDDSASPSELAEGLLTSTDFVEEVDRNHLKVSGHNSIPYLGVELAQHLLHLYDESRLLGHDAYMEMVQGFVEGPWMDNRVSVPSGSAWEGLDIRTSMSGPPQEYLIGNYPTSYDSALVQGHSMLRDDG
ncbi:MAG: hypothetical protein ABEH38_09715 [Flavobacteriales bacterium]